MGSRQASKAYATKAITDKKARSSQVFNRLIKSYHSTVQPRGRRPCSRTTVYVSAWRNRTYVMWWRTRHFYRLHVGRMRATASICDNPIAFILTSRPSVFGSSQGKRCAPGRFGAAPMYIQRDHAMPNGRKRQCQHVRADANTFAIFYRRRRS